MTPAAALSSLATRIAAPGMADGLHPVVRLRVFDTLVATSLGLRIPESKALMDLSGGGPTDRVRMLVAATRATEVDDIAITGCVTAGAVVVPTALALADAFGSDDSTLSDAIVGGYEAMIGFGAMIGGANIIYRGIWPTLAAAPIGTAAITARLLGLSVETTANALALAIGRSVWWMDHGLPRWLQLGHAAADGIFAAQAARAGFRAPPDVLANWGAAAKIDLCPELLAQDAAHRITTVDTKPFPTSRQGLAAIEAFTSLHQQRATKADDRIEVALPGAYKAMVGNTQLPPNRMASIVSVAYQMALVVHASNRLYDVVRDGLPDSPEIKNFLGQVAILQEAALDDAYPAAWGGRVTVIDRAGAARTSTVLNPSGSAGQTTRLEELSLKAERLARANGISSARFDALRDDITAGVAPGALLKRVMGD